MPKTILNKQSMGLILDLEQDFGIKEDVSRELVEKIGEEAVKTIIKRSLSHKSLEGKKFKPYTSEYAKRKGVSRGSVNLKLHGDMFDSLGIGETTSKTVKIDFDDPLQSLKAFNHHTGDTLPRRPFFGLQKKEINEIKKRLKKDLEKEKKRTQEEKDKINLFLERQDQLIEDLVSLISSEVVKFG